MFAHLIRQRRNGGGEIVRRVKIAAHRRNSSLDKTWFDDRAAIKHLQASWRLGPGMNIMFAILRAMYTPRKRCIKRQMFYEWAMSVFLRLLCTLYNFRGLINHSVSLLLDTRNMLILKCQPMDGRSVRSTFKRLSTYLVVESQVIDIRGCIETFTHNGRCIIV